MASIKDISSIWKNIKEVDLKPIRDAATRPLRIVVVGTDGAGKHTLAEQMRTDPAKPEIHTQSTLALIELQNDIAMPAADLIILLVDATRTDYSIEQELARKWSEAGKNVLVFINKIDLVSGNIVVASGQDWPGTKVIWASANDISSLRGEFIPAVLELLPQQHIALGRQFPLFRLTIATQLITETCFSNAAYSFSTGLAEIVPVLDLPLNLTDMIVLTKSQAFLAYKLGLLVGFSTRWQDYVSEFGGVLGSGFIWRQIARSLVGLVPGWGIIPKVAVAYSGTYVVGHAILGWYLSGRHLNAKQLRALSKQAFTQGKEYTRRLVARIPKRKQRSQPADQYRVTEGKAELPAGNSEGLPEETIIEKKPGLPSMVVAENGGNNQAQPVVIKKSREYLPGFIRRVKMPRLRRSKRNVQEHESIPGPATSVRVCERCSKASSPDAQYCQYCGLPFN